MGKMGEMGMGGDITECHACNILEASRRPLLAFRTSKHERLKDAHVVKKPPGSLRSIRVNESLRKPDWY